MKTKLILMIALILSCINIFSLSGVCENINVDFFVMSRCPYGTQAENVFAMLNKTLKDKMKFNLYFIANEDTNGDIISLRGPLEVEEDIRQLVIFTFFPDKFWRYVTSRNTDFANPQWKADAYLAGIDIQQLQSLMDTKGKELLRGNIKKSRQMGIDASPTIFINGEKYNGSRSFPALFLRLAKKINDKKILAGLPQCFSDTDCIDSNSIAVCQNPATASSRCEALEVSLKIVDVKDKAYLNDQTYVGIKHYLASLKESFVDYLSEEAKVIIGKTSAQSLPIYLVSSSVEKIKDLNWLFSQIVSSAQGRIQQGNQEYFVINNSRDHLRFYLKRERKPQHLDLFVMSKCPFGIEAEQAIYPVAKNRGLDLNIHYIAGFSSGPEHSPNQKPYQLTSLHGETEIEEDELQLCVKKYFRQKYFDYILSRDKNINNTQGAAAGEVLSNEQEAKIRKCQLEEGQGLLSKNMAFAQELGIGSSPTILWENQRRFANLKELKEGLELFKDIEIKTGGSCK